MSLFQRGLILGLVLICAFSCAKNENVRSDSLPNLPGSGWTMTWNDEFNGTTLDTSKGWSVPDSSPWHNPNNKSFITFADGHLTLHAEGNQCAYIETANKKSFYIGT